MKVNLIQNDSQWILGKFSDRMCEQLNKMGIDAVVSRFRNPHADINHYPVHNTLFDGITNKHDTFMITHVNSVEQLRIIKRKLRNRGMGICMSKYTMDMLAQWGIPRNKLCYINPAHDHIISPRKYLVGITHRSYQKVDCRKRESFLIDICDNIDLNCFKFVIMGAGWEEIIQQLRERNVEVEYYPEFDYEIYTYQLMPSLDYWLYFGTDEGNMGFLDALAAGVETIATPQGFHLDAKGGLTYPCETLDDFVNAFSMISKKKKDLVHSVEDWTWENFAKKHVEIWHYLLDDYDLDELYKNRGLYSDGIYSVLPQSLKKENTFQLVKRKLPGIIDEYAENKKK